MTPTFSEEEYRRVLVLAYLGEWVMNAIRKDPEAEAEDTLSRLFSFCQGTSLQSLVGYDAQHETWLPTEAFEEQAHAFIDQYDDKTFWEELTARLTERDLLEAYGERAVRGMRPEARERAASKFAQAYTREFEQHGLSRLRLPPSAIQAGKKR